MSTDNRRLRGPVRIELDQHDSAGREQEDGMENAMSKQQAAAGLMVDRDDVIRVLGEMDDAMIIEILALKPTLNDLEQAAMWSAGDGDVLAKQGHPLGGVVADIVDLLTADEEELPPTG
jgi:hypothetical protein